MGHASPDPVTDFELQRRCSSIVRAKYIHPREVVYAESFADDRRSHPLTTSLTARLLSWNGRHSSTTNLDTGASPALFHMTIHPHELESIQPCAARI